MAPSGRSRLRLRELYSARAVDERITAPARSWRALAGTEHSLS
jgi:hypothetical protein